MRTIVNVVGKVVCYYCGHPDECHNGGENRCVLYEEPCPCYPDLPGPLLPPDPKWG